MKKCRSWYVLLIFVMCSIIPLCKSERSLMLLYSTYGYTYELKKDDLKISVRKPTNQEKNELIGVDTWVLKQLKKSYIQPLLITITNTTDKRSVVSLQDLDFLTVDEQLVFSVIHKRPHASGIALGVASTITASAVLPHLFIFAFFGGVGFSAILSIFVMVPVIISLPIIIPIFISRLMQANRAKNTLQERIIQASITLAPGESYSGIAFVRVVNGYIV